MVHGPVLRESVPEVATVTIGSSPNCPAHSLNRSARTSEFLVSREGFPSFLPLSYHLPMVFALFQGQVHWFCLYGLIDVLVFFLVAVAVGELEDAVAALTTAVIALVKDSPRAVKTAAGTPPTPRAWAVSTMSLPILPTFVCRLISVAEKSNVMLINWRYTCIRLYRYYKR